jgi:hypothetical protein
MKAANRCSGGSSRVRSTPTPSFPLSQDALIAPSLLDLQFEEIFFKLQVLLLPLNHD